MARPGKALLAADTGIDMVDGTARSEEGLGLFGNGLGGFCGGWLFDYIRPSRIKQKSKTINFKKAAKQYNKEQAKKPYKRKCDVCGRTDTDFPDLEFRFCSQCAGYHCFCIDHINSHIHFKE